MTGAPATQYWAYRGSKAFWTVRSPRHEWPDKLPAYVAGDIDDLLLWMTVQEIDRMELRPLGVGVPGDWLLVRSETLTPGELKTEKTNAPIKRRATPSREDGRRSRG